MGAAGSTPVGGTGGTGGRQNEGAPTSVGKGGGPSAPELRMTPGTIGHGTTGAVDPFVTFAPAVQYEVALAPFADALEEGCAFRSEVGDQVGAAVSLVPSTGSAAPSGTITLRPAATLSTPVRWLLRCTAPAAVMRFKFTSYSVAAGSTAQAFAMTFSTGSAPTVIDALHGTVAAKQASLSVTLSEPIRAGDLAGVRLTLGGVVVPDTCPHRGSGGCIDAADEQPIGGFGMRLPPGVASGGDAPLGLLFPANAKGPGGASFADATTASAWSLGPPGTLSGDDVAFTFTSSGWAYGKDSARWTADTPAIAAP